MTKAPVTRLCDSPRWLAAVSCLLASCLSTTVVGAPPSLNLAQTLAPIKSRLASGGQANIVVLGDSLTGRPGSYFPVFRDLLQNRYGNAGAGYQGMSLWTGAGFNQGWIYTGINTDIVPHRALDGLWNRYDGVAPWPNQAIVTPYGRQVEIQYIAQPGGGSFHLRHGDFGPIVDTIDTNSATTSLATYRYNLPAGETKYTIQPAGGSFTVLGQNNVSPNAGVRLHRGANGGWGVNNFLQRDWTFDSQLDLLDPDLIMVWIGQNDQGFTQSSYAAKIDQLVTRLQATSPTARIVLIGTYNQGSSPLAGLVEGMADVALARGLGFINLYATAGSPEFFQNNGYLDDAVHFSPAGGQYMGHFLYNAFISDGWSLAPFTTPEIGTGTHQNLPTPNHQSMPEPGALGIIGLGAVMLSRRIRRTVTC